MWKRKPAAQEPPALSEAQEDAPDPVRPVVRLPGGGLSTGAITVGAAFAAILLFSALDARQRTPVEPSIWSGARDVGPTAGEPPPLQIPRPPASVVPVSMVIPAASASEPLPPSPQTIRSYYQRAASPPAQTPAYYPPPAPPSYASAPTPAPAHNASGTTLVIDTTTPASGGAAGTGGAGASPLSSAAGGPARARSSMLANRAATVPQGTLIPAVLETAFDSTRPGFARAIVSRDVRGFDGAKILIPRGSSLVGEYHSDAAPGQNRATIMWTRLLRPDGVTIALDSPAVDPVGRGGVRASVNNHIPARVFNALLQSSFEVGSLLATRAATGSVIVALPTSVQSSVTPQTQQTTIAPTLKVAAGTSISIFVARDLEFGAESHE